MGGVRKLVMECGGWVVRRLREVGRLGGSGEVG